LKLSVVLPVYNDEGGIPELLLSLTKQTTSPFELIVIDDGSTVPLEALLAHQSSIFLDFPLRLIRNELPQGPARSRNQGIKVAKGDIIVFLDSDCIPPLDWLETISSTFKSNSLINVLAGTVFVPSPSHFSKAVSLLGYPAGGNLGFEKMWSVSPQLTTRHLSSCNFAINRTLLKKHNLVFNESFPLAGGEDVELSERITGAGISIYFNPKLRVSHRPVLSLAVFLKWHFRRGRSLIHLRHSGIELKPIFRLRGISFFHSLAAAPTWSYVPALIGLQGCQCLAQFVGALFENFNGKAIQILKMAGKPA
jgi:glycosyltransferase involved in cell wall biosynthesis